MQGRWSTPLNIHFGNLLHTKGVVPLNIILSFPPPALTPSANPGAAVPDPNSIHFGPTAKGKKGKPSTSADPHEQLNEPGTRGRMNTIWLGPLNEEYVNPLVLEAKSNLTIPRPISRGGRWSNNMDLGDIRLPSQPPEDDEPSGSSGQPKEEDVLMDGPSSWLDGEGRRREGCARLAIMDTWIRCRGTLTAVQAEKFTEEVGRSGFSLENIDPEVGRQVFFGDASSSNAAIGPWQKAMLQALDRICCPLETGPALAIVQFALNLLYLGTLNPFK
ncbi:hypothetical protein EV363DRAFT_1405710 [Boletus edulis]|nr:hypothetical protein EV363DRAFT_1405710 [Boletus edulis]